MLDHPGHTLLWFWQIRKDRAKLVQQDAVQLLDEFGPHAYEEARTRARAARLGIVIDNRPYGHWDRVRRVMEEYADRHYIDTATRYL